MFENNKVIREKFVINEWNIHVFSSEEQNMVVYDLFLKFFTTFLQKGKCNDAKNEVYTNYF